MLTCKRISGLELNEHISQTVVQVCTELELDLEYNLITKYFSGSAAALQVLLEADTRYTYIMYEDGTPIGAMAFSEEYVPYLSCKCIAENFLFIRKEYRSYRTLVFLVKSALKDIQEQLSEPALVFAGNLLGKHHVETIYRRLGFSVIGSHLVKELGEQYG